MKFSGPVNFATPAWEDLRYPAQSINPAGSATPPSVSNSTGMLEFAGGSTDNVVAGEAQIPHAWRSETSIYPHIHLLFTVATAGVNSIWKFEYNVFPIFGTASSAAYGSYVALPNITVANPNNARKIVLAAFDPIPMTGCGGSSSVLWKLTRVASDTVNDTDTNSIALIELDFHYMLDKMGSATEIPS